MKCKNFSSTPSKTHKNKYMAYFVHFSEEKTPHGGQGFPRVIILFPQSRQMSQYFWEVSEKLNDCIKKLWRQKSQFRTFENFGVFLALKFSRRGYQEFPQGLQYISLDIYGNFQKNLNDGSWVKKCQRQKHKRHKSAYCILWRLADKIRISKGRMKCCYGWSVSEHWMERVYALWTKGKGQGTNTTLWSLFLVN